MYSIWFPYIVSGLHGTVYSDMETAIHYGKECGFSFNVTDEATNEIVAMWEPITGLTIFQPEEQQ